VRLRASPVSIAVVAMVARKKGSTPVPRNSGFRTTHALPADKQSVALTEHLIMAAVESLYADELKPIGRILRKRVVELTKSDIDVGRELRAACEKCPLLHLQPEDAGDWSALLVGRALTFVDIYSTEDVYSDDFWAKLANHFESLPADEAPLPGGRYSCACALMAKNLPFLVGLSLGRVCHVVELALTHRKVLGYRDGAVVPYVLSQTRLKEQQAMRRQLCCAPDECRGDALSGLPAATWNDACARLQELLIENASANGEGRWKMPLSNVKRLFRLRFGMELSETVLGHSKLSELLQDTRFCDVCAVELHDNGYIVVQPSVSAKVPDTNISQQSASCGSKPPCERSSSIASRQKPSCLDEQSAFEDTEESLERVAAPVAACTWPPWSPSSLSKDGLRCVVKNTFIHSTLDSSMSGLAGSAKLRSRSVPKDMCTCDGARLETAGASPYQLRQPAHDGVLGSALDLGDCDEDSATDTVSVANGMPSTPSSTASPSGHRGMILPKDRNACAEEPWDMMCRALCLDSCSFDVGIDWAAASSTLARSMLVDIESRCSAPPFEHPCSECLDGMLCSTCFEPFATCSHACDLMADSQNRNGEEWHSFTHCCPDELVSLDDAEMFPEVPLEMSVPVGTLAACTEFSCLSSALVRDGYIGCIVRNTFIDTIPTTLGSPQLGARQRARSVPKDIGSQWFLGMASDDLHLSEPKMFAKCRSDSTASTAEGMESNMGDRELDSLDEEEGNTPRLHMPLCSDATSSLPDFGNQTVLSRTPDLHGCPKLAAWSLSALAIQEDSSLTDVLPSPALKTSFLYCTYPYAPRTLLAEEQAPPARPR